MILLTIAGGLCVLASLIILARKRPEVVLGLVGVAMLALSGALWVKAEIEHTVDQINATVTNTVTAPQRAAADAADKAKSLLPWRH